MFAAIFKKPDTRTIPNELYGKVMTRSREPVFYERFGVPDTVMGRFDMLSLHVYLLARRLRSEGSETALNLSQQVFDLFVADVERALRELGIGDTSVPKRKKRMVRSFYGQIEDFDTPLDEGDRKTLEKKVAARFFTAKPDKSSRLLSGYIRTASAVLGEQAMDRFVKGYLEWPDL